MKHIALLGECMIELNGAPFGAMMQTFGGDALNSAVYLARAAQQHIAVHFVTVMGVDALSQGMISRWQQEGVNTDLVLRDDAHHPGLYLIQLDEQGERTFLYWRNNSAARYLLQHPDFSAVKQQLKTMDAIYVSGISLAILPIADRELLIDLLQQLASQGKEIIFDSNYRPALWLSKEETQACYQRLMSFTDVALMTDEDEQQIWGDSTIDDTLQRLAAAGVKQAIVKAGAKGCYYQNLSQQGEVQFIATTPVQHVVDTTSAGDAFNAGFLAGYLTGKNIEKSAVMGHQLAGVVIQHKGAIITPQATENVTKNFIFN